MRLTPFQRLVLQNTLELQGREPSYRRALRRLVPGWIVFLAVGFAAWYAIRNWLNGNGAEYIALGLVLGAIAAQFGALRNFIQAWQLQKRYVDFGAVERLLAEDDAAKAAGEGRAKPPRPPVRWITVLAIAAAVVALPLGIDRALTVYHDPVGTTAPKQVNLYATAWCGQCRVVRAHLERRGVEYVEHDVEKSVAAYYAWNATRSRGVPVIVVDAQVVRGANLAKLDDALRAAGIAFPERGAPKAGLADGPMSPFSR
jgi:glutaredoxin